LTDNELAELASLFTEVKVAAGEIIVKEGDPVDSVYLIAVGSAEVKHIAINGGKTGSTAVAILGAHDAIGLNETGFYSLSGKRTATVVATTDMILFRLSVAAFHGFSLTHAHVSQVIHEHESLIKDKF
jgi:CRP-like cAMP-binding protein